MLAVGSLIGGTYRIVRLLGQGGMGAVYEAAHMRIPRSFAVKVLQGMLAEHPEALARFEREAMLGSRLGHDHIVQVFDFNRTEDGAPYMVMELLSGNSLAETVHAQGPLEVPRAARLIRQVALALAAAHDEGIIHRDLKPENIFICHSNVGETAKVLDFGLAKALASRSGMTGDASVLGTPHYMAPEQARGRINEIDARTDLFALGMVLYFVLAGRPPFQGSDAPSVLYQVVHEPLPPLTALRSDLPQALLNLIARATAKLPAERHASANDFIAELDRCVDTAGQPTLPPPVRRVVTGPGVGQDIAMLPTSTPAAADTTFSRTAGEVHRTAETRQGGPRWRVRLAVGGALVLVAGVAGIGLHLTIRSPQRAPLQPPRPAVTAPARPDGAVPSAATRPALAPDATVARPPTTAATPRKVGKKARKSRIVEPPPIKPLQPKPKKKPAQIGNDVVDD